MSRIQSEQQFVKRYLMRRPKCGHRKLRQIVEMVSPRTYTEAVITTYPSYNYDYCEWSYYKKVETLGEN